MAEKLWWLYLILTKWLINHLIILLHPCHIWDATIYIHLMKVLINKHILLHKYLQNFYNWIKLNIDLTDLFIYILIILRRKRGVKWVFKNCGVRASLSTSIILVWLKTLGLLLKKRSLNWFNKTRIVLL
jgi:hypothetical protein